MIRKSTGGATTRIVLSAKSEGRLVLFSYNFFFSKQATAAIVSGQRGLALFFFVSKASVSI